MPRVGCPVTVFEHSPAQHGAKAIRWRTSPDLQCRGLITRRGPPNRPWYCARTRRSFTRAHEWEQDRLADPQTGERHHQPVDTHPDPAGRRHRILHRPQELFVQDHRLVVTQTGDPGLILESQALNDRIDQLGITGGHFGPADVQVPFLGQAGLGRWSRVSGEVSTG